MGSWPEEEREGMGQGLSTYQERAGPRDWHVPIPCELPGGVDYYPKHII